MDGWMDGWMLLEFYGRIRTNMSVGTNMNYYVDERNLRHTEVGRHMDSPNTST
jgi:hypothetical protein